MLRKKLYLLFIINCENNISVVYANSQINNVIITKNKEKTEVNNKRKFLIFIIFLSSIGGLFVHQFIFKKREKSKLLIDLEEQYKEEENIKDNLEKFFKENGFNMYKEYKKNKYLLYFAQYCFNSNLKSDIGKIDLIINKVKEILEKVQSSTIRKDVQHILDSWIKEKDYQKDRKIMLSLLDFFNKNNLFIGYMISGDVSTISNFNGELFDYSGLEKNTAFYKINLILNKLNELYKKSDYEDIKEKIDKIIDSWKNLKENYKYNGSRKYERNHYTYKENKSEFKLYGDIDYEVMDCKNTNLIDFRIFNKNGQSIKKEEITEIVEKFIGHLENILNKNEITFEEAVLISNYYDNLCKLLNGFFDNYIQDTFYNGNKILRTGTRDHQSKKLSTDLIKRGIIEKDKNKGIIPALKELLNKYLK